MHLLRCPQRPEKRAKRNILRFKASRGSFCAHHARKSGSKGRRGAMTHKSAYDGQGYDSESMAECSSMTHGMVHDMCPPQ